jgi:hypothetical protein
LEVGSGCESWGFVSLIVLFYGGGYCPDAGKLHLLHRVSSRSGRDGVIVSRMDNVVDYPDGQVDR